MPELSGALLLQLLILGLCAAILLHWVLRFPHPTLLVGPFLPPDKRWPVPQLWKWVEEGSPDPGFIHFFMRDPERVPPPGTEWVAPVDGTVLAVLEHRDRRFVVISLNVWDVHVARSPFDGKVTSICDAGDVFEPSRDDPLRDEPFYFLREKRSPKQRYLEIETGQGLVRLRLITSYLSRRIEFFCEAGQKLARGERIGRMLFGSTCVVEADTTVPFAVKVGQRLTAGETLITQGLKEAEAGR